MLSLSGKSDIDRYIASLSFLLSLISFMFVSLFHALSLRVYDHISNQYEYKSDLERFEYET
jgi:hypothetical protein